MSLGFSTSICFTFSKFPCRAITKSRISSVEGRCCSVCTGDCCLLESIIFACIRDQDGLVGPVGFEPTTSGPDLLGVTSAPGSPSITGLWYPLGGVNPLDQARRRPPLLRLNPQLFYLSFATNITSLFAFPFP